MNVKNKIKVIKKYADEDSNKMVTGGTLSTPESVMIGKTFWYIFYFIFYCLQALTGNLKNINEVKNEL